jgi:hypothetical protein
MPAKKSLLGERLGKMLGRIEHHFDDAFDIPFGSSQSTDFDAETAGDRGSHLAAVEHLTFDLTRFEDIFGQCFENGFCPQLKAERFHPPHEVSLLETDLAKTLSEALRLPSEAGPIRALVKVDSYSPHHVRRMLILFTAKARVIHRTACGG